MSRLIDVDALITQQALRQDIIERLCNMGSVIVKGMEMPQKCGQCKLYHAEHPMHCMAVEGHRTVGAPYGMSRPDWCPLVEIPTSHGRLIDADELKTAFPRCDNSMDIKIASVRATINHAPTIIEAEGSEE